MRRLAGLMIALLFNAKVSGYTIQGLDVAVDYWAGSGSNETLVVIDWNIINGPYSTESHAWGFRWEGDAYVSDALSAIDAAGALDITTQYEGAFLGDAYYNNLLIDSDNHTSEGFTGWWWTGSTTNGGATWNSNTDGINATALANGRIEGFNLVHDFDEWLVGDATLTIPVPEPCTFAILGLGGLLIFRKKHYVNG